MVSVNRIHILMSFELMSYEHTLIKFNYCCRDFLIKVLISFLMEIHFYEFYIPTIQYVPKQFLLFWNPEFQLRFQFESLHYWVWVDYISKIKV